MLVLASTSRYRRDLLARLGLAFEVARPDVDETPLPGESPSVLARRLARAKAQAVARSRPDAAVIGSDQSCALDGRILGKPGDGASARDQLTRLSGRSLRFHTAVCIAADAGTRLVEDADETEVVFRRLRPDEIERYLALEDVLDCAGSFKAEGLGIVLFERLHSDDPTGLIGLPLTRTARMLREFGIDPLAVG